MNKRGRVGWLWWILVGGLVVLVLVTWRVNARAENEWNRMMSEVAMLRSEVESHSDERPPIRGEARSGKAWARYRLAMQDVSSAAQDLFSEPDPSPPEAVQAELANLKDALQMIREGAEAGVVGLELEIDTIEQVPVFKSLALAYALRIQARTEMEAGDARAAVDRIADGLQFGRDHMQRGVLLTTLIGCVTINTQLQEVGRWLRDGRLDRESAGELLRVVAMLDDALPPEGRWLDSETLFTAHFLERARAGSEDSREFQPPTLSLWRYGFSFRLAAAEWWEHAKAMRADARRGVEHAGPKTRTGNPIVDLVAPTTGRIQEERWTRTSLRIVRVALDQLVGGDAETSAAAAGQKDAWGRELRRRSDGDTLVVWSDGKDEVDGGGVIPTEPFDPDNADIVLVVKVR